MSFTFFVFYFLFAFVGIFHNSRFLPSLLRLSPTIFEEEKDGEASIDTDRLCRHIIIYHPSLSSPWIAKIHHRSYHGRD